MELSHLTDPNVLEDAARAATIPASKVAGRFAYQGSNQGRSEKAIADIHANLSFGTIFTDHMAQVSYSEAEGWHNRRLVDYGDLQLSPAAAVLHYGQEIFEGLKAYRHADGSLWTFRPGYNAARFNASARRMAMPEVPVEDFLASIVDLVRKDGAYVPAQAGAALYLRPFMFASEPFLGVRPAHRYEFLTIASPVGPYFTDGFKPVSIWVTKDFHRAGPGGTGAAKTGGNYASSLLPQQYAGERGFDQVCFVDACGAGNLEELGGMNVFAVYRDGRVATPKLTGTILQGGTRSSIIALLGESGTTVSEVTLPLAELIDDIQAGQVTELFACGTAAVVTPIGQLASHDFDVQLPAGEVTADIHRRLTAIQEGRAEDTHNWMYRID